MARIVASTQLATLVLSSALSAQGPQWHVQGDTGGGPAGCAAAAISALDQFFRAMGAADSARFAAVVAPRFAFSTGNWAPTDRFVDIESVPELVQYARLRAGARERVTIESIQFNGRRGRELHFGPIRFVRRADDLPARGGPAVGKGMYVCGQGIGQLHLGRPLR